MKNDYAQRQAAWLKEHNITVGSLVRVVRAAKDLEDGWGEGWAGEMAAMVGQVFEVREIGGAGIYLGGWFFPYFVLEPVTDAETPSTDGNAPASEMTKREVMAMANLQGLLANANLNEMTGNTVTEAVLLADDLIAELNKKE